jgi:hypothetical protein
MSTTLARRFKVDVSVDNVNWVPFKGITDFSPTEKPTMVSTANYDNNGFDSFEKTLTNWTAIVKMDRQVNAGVFDPGQELARATKYQFGDQARLYIRWYDRNNAPEAYTGRAVIDYSQSKTAVADVEEITVTFNGDGIVSAITNPVTNLNSPVITSVLPSGAATGALIRIQGAYFTGTVVSTGVKIGGVSATTWDVVSDSLIEAVVPAGSAGSAPVTVTNANGTSATFAYTRAA